MTQTFTPALGGSALTPLHDAAIALLPREACYDGPRACYVVSTSTGSVSVYTTRNEAHS